MPHIPRLLRFMALHAAGGIAAGWLFLLILLKLDTFGLNTLIRSSEHQVIVLVMLFWMFAVTFGAVGVMIGILTKEGTAFRDKDKDRSDVWKDDEPNGEDDR